MSGQIIDEDKRGLLQVTIWKNPGEKGPFFTATIKRSYRDQQGDWQETKMSLPVRDCLQMARMLEWANDRTHEHLRSAKDAASATDEDQEAAPY